MRDRIHVGELTVARLGFGAMQLTGPGVWGPPGDRAQAIAVLRRAVELGVELIDTADSYGPESADEIIREALHPYPDQVKIATKAGFARPGPGHWVTLGTPEHLRSSCEASLTRLGVDRIDLFQLHRIDPNVPAADQFETLRELRDEGKVAEVGLSEVSVADIEHARQVVPIASVQNRYNVGARGAEDVVDYCAAAGIAFIPWEPLANGRLAAPGGPLEQVATEVGASVLQVCLAWLLRRSPMMLPIPGTSSVAHLEQNCAAADVELTQAQFDELDGARKALRRIALS